MFIRTVSLNRKKFFNNRKKKHHFQRQRTTQEEKNRYANHVPSYGKLTIVYSLYSLVQHICCIFQFKWLYWRYLILPSSRLYVCIQTKNKLSSMTSDVREIFNNFFWITWTLVNLKKIKREKKKRKKWNEDLKWFWRVNIYTVSRFL